MAEAIFDSPASEADLSWKARSAGVAALVGEPEPIAPRAEALLRELGIPTEGDRAKQVDKTILEEADLVPAMPNSTRPRWVASLPARRPRFTRCWATCGASKPWRASRIPMDDPLPSAARPFVRSSTICGSSSKG